MRKVAILAVSLVFAIAAVGCTGVAGDGNIPLAPNTPPPSEELPGQNEVQTPVHPGPEPIHAEGAIENNDGTIDMVVSTRYTADMPRGIIEVLVSVTNISDAPVAYVHGSGSNNVPDAIKADLGGLVTTYKPVISTMDYQTMFLEPSETLVKTLTFAPFHSADEFPMVPPGSGMDAFEDAQKFTPAAAGPVEGFVNFTYYVSPAEEIAEDNFGALAFIEQGEGHTISVEFGIELGE